MQYSDPDVYCRDVSSITTKILTHSQKHSSKVTHLANASRETTHIDCSEGLSLEYFVKRGLEYLQQGKLDEGVTLLTRLYEQLPPGQRHLASELDSFRQEYTAYRQAQSALQEASVHFARVYAELQGKIADLTVALSTRLNNIDAFHQHLPMNDGQDQSLLHSVIQKQQTFTSLPLEPSTERDNASPCSLFITCLGPFEVRQQGKELPFGTSRGGQRVLRYLVAQPGYSATSDVLQTLLWAEDEPEVAQRKLHSAISALRRGLNQGETCEHEGGYIIYKHGSYTLNPALTIRTDVDEFLQLYQAGKRASTEQVACYEQACQLYKKPFLMEDVYEDWPSLQREQLSQIYLTMCQALTEHYLAQQSYDDAAKWATAVLKQNRCDETAHRRLIQIYALQGRRSEALQQYQRCKQILHEELSVQPLPETTHLFQTLLTSGKVLPDEEKM